MRRRIRQQLDTADTDTAFVFLALGHFERKGLPELLAAFTRLGPELSQARLWVVGGEPDLVASYRDRAVELGVAERVKFVGRAEDVRPYLWSADAFVSPSHYEAFSLGLLEAAAAGLPLLATRISGSEELLEDDVNGFELHGDPASIAATLRRFLETLPGRRAEMREAARWSVEPLSPERFAHEWKALYASLSR